MMIHLELNKILKTNWQMHLMKNKNKEFNLTGKNIFINKWKHNITIKFKRKSTLWII